METPLRSIAFSADTSGSKISRIQVVMSLEIIQDLIVISLCLGLFCTMVLQLWETFSTTFVELHFHAVTADIMFAS